MMNDALKSFWYWLRFGTVRAETRSIDGGVDSEIAYIGRAGKIVGYWAYGHFDPAMPLNRRNQMELLVGSIFQRRAK